MDTIAPVFDNITLPSRGHLLLHLFRLPLLLLLKIFFLSLRIQSRQLSISLDLLRLLTLQITLLGFLSLGSQLQFADCAFTGGANLA